ncbi:Uu.00g059220.m01.CDS01 [Anthostomella pinea]|uniref:DNA ligase n=1 Tax=Anthostomella pinea TaxID=933095 RepID=A0AAI8YMB0_9PEZI|nr:Uu.00g059220.m01.CDS01 [Anthostomella pinea]
MAPKQATLGKFFGKPNGSKPAPTQQSKLSFGTKSAKKTKDESEAATSEPSPSAKKVKKEVEAKENKTPSKDTKKRSRPSHSPSDKKKESSTKVKVEEPEEDLEEEVPVTKRQRRNRTRIEDDEDDEDDDEVMADAEPVKPKKKGAATVKESIKKPSAVTSASEKQAASKVKEEDDEVEEATASDSASETENEEDEEEEKPEVAAKAREKLQTKLKAKNKDPYPDWKAGSPVPYAALCTTFSLIELTTKRLIITEHCSLFLQQVLRLTPDDFLPTVLLMVNKLAPDYAGIELGIGESLIMKAIGETTGRSLQVIKADQKEIGDLGLVAVKSRSTQPTMFKPKPLTIRSVHKGLMDVATVTGGGGAQGRKVDLIKKLLSAADAHSSGKIDINKDKGGPSEAKYIVRFLEGKLRLGLAERTVLVSIGQAVACHEASQKGKIPSTTQMEEAEALLKTVYSELPSWDVIIPAMVRNGIMNLRDSCKLRPGVPLKPMLAKPTKAITEVLDRFENQTFTCEYKYDGERAQIHYVAKDRSEDLIEALPSATKEAAKGVASIFSRNSEDLSKKYPDILGKLHTWVKEGTKSFVLDCETVAWDVTEKKVLPFQQLMTRKKKDVKVEDVKVKVCVFAFDLLFLNGEALVEKSLRERRELMHGAFNPVEGEFAYATHMNGQELEEIQIFLDESVKASCEGLMVKMLDGSESGYEPSKRSRNWLKIKKDYLSSVGDSLDLVVLGAYHGKGKRTSVYGAFLLACYNLGTETYETVCNIGTGFSEQVLEELHKQLSEITIDRPKPFYSHSSGGQHQPDVWFEPQYVWEVKTADLTLSPRYKAGMKEKVDPAGEKGISLRFPRFIKIRDDKKPDEATSSRQVAEMYRKQESVTKSKGPSVDDDFDARRRPHTRRTRRDRERDPFFADLFALPGFKDCFAEVERARQQSLRDDPPTYRRRVDVDPYHQYPPRPDYAAQADAYEAAEPDAALVEVRAALRAHLGLSDLARLVLLLTTQVPAGRFTTYRAMQEHVSEVRFGLCAVRQIGHCLRKNPLGDRVPGHRVVGQYGMFSRPLEWGMHCRDVEETVRRLGEEGVRFKADGNPKGSAFREFVGCPRV